MVYTSIPQLAGEWQILYVRNTDMTSCGKDTKESDGRTRCHCHYFSPWERTLSRDNASYATVTAKHKTTTAGNSSIIVSLIALSSDRWQIPWNAVLQFLKINCESIKILGNVHSARAPSLPTTLSLPPLQYHHHLFSYDSTRSIMLLFLEKKKIEWITTQ